MMRPLATILLSSLLVAIVVGALPAQGSVVPTRLRYQARLLDSSGTPVNQTNLTVRFRIYTSDSPSATHIYEDTQTGISVNSGVLSVEIGGGPTPMPIPPGLFSMNPGGDLWLGIKIGTDNEMTPRLPIAAVPFANVARRAETATDVPGVTINPSTVNATSVNSLTVNATTALDTNSVRIGGTEVINNLGEWVGAPIVTIPTGAVLMSASSNAPTGFLICNGAAVSRTTYADLFSAIGITYGSGDGATTFNLPNLTQRFPMGRAISGTGSTLGEVGGAIDHTHPSAIHNHSINGHNHGISHTHPMGHGHGIPNHDHDMSNHTHTISGHKHGVGSLTVPQGGTHRHEVGLRAQGGTNSSRAGMSGPSGGSTAEILTRTQGGNGAHTHTVAGEVGNLGGPSGDNTLGSSFPSVARTGTQTNFGTLGSNVANTGGSSAGATTTDGLTTNDTMPPATGAHNPPFITLNFMIKY